MAELARSLSLTQLIFYGVGTIVGAGIYTIIGSAAELAGGALWISMTLAACTAFLTALSYAELIAMLPKAGAEYQFLKEAFPKHPWIWFVAGYLIALNGAATPATVSLAFAGYVNAFVEMPAKVVALSLLTLCTVLNVAGIRQSTWVSIGLILIEVGGLLLLITMGLSRGSFEQAVALPTFGDAGGIFAATALIFFVYVGFEDVANLAEESRQPQKNVPRALLVSVALTSVIYILVIWAVFAVIEPKELAQSDSPLRTAGTVIAPWLGETLTVTALFATASTALISLVSISRLLFAMAREGDMPRPLSRTLSRRKTPWVAALALYAGACVLVPLGEVKIIASIAALGILTVFVGVHAAVITLRRNQPLRERPFKIPLSISNVPVFPCLGIATALALMTQFEAIVYAITAGAMAFGLVLFSIVNRRKRRSTL